MKGKRTLIISSLIMMLTLVVAIVGVTAAWFGDVTERTLDADLSIGSDTVDSSVAVNITSKDPGGNIYPAVAIPGHFGGSGLTPPTHGALYATGETADKSIGIEKNAKIYTLLVSINYVGSADDGATDGRKSLKFELNGVYLASSVGADGTVADGTFNYVDEFDCNISLGTVDADGNFTETASADSPTNLSGDAIYYNMRDLHTLEMRVMPGTYTVKFEVYFNKIDEECNFDLLGTELTMIILFSQLTTMIGG